MDGMQPTVLVRSRIFDGLTDSERQQCLEQGESLTLKRGHVLARQGEAARGGNLAG